ncbi:MAG TPA: hypothetical protein VMF87_33285 [Streptosporangiaceae bacterium]|nr:hypothetical protein [Streptosporangiaceae bacterium]
MRLRLLDRVRRSRRRRQGDETGARKRPDPAAGPAPGSAVVPPGAHRRTARPAAPASLAGGASGATGPSGTAQSGGAGGSPGGVAAGSTPPPARTGQPGGHALPRRWGIARAATRAEPKTGQGAQTGRTAQTAQRSAGADASAEAARTQARAGSRQAAAARPPWYEIAQTNRTALGRRHCGRLEPLVHREWPQDVAPPAEVVRAVDRLAELPQLIKSRLAQGLDAIYVGLGGVPDLDDMGRLHGVPLPSGRATWDACAGAYGERKIIVGSRPSPSPDVMCHEIGHALDDIDGEGDEWQSDSADFQSLYDQCRPHMVSAFHRQPGLLGRREFFADAFAAIASRQRPALVEMLGGDTRAALNVMLYFNVRYGI